MSKDPHDRGEAPVEEGIVLRNSSPARVSFNSKTGKAQRTRNIFKDDQAEHAAQGDSLQGDPNRILQDEERLLHVEDSAFKPTQPLRLETEPRETTVLQPDDEQRVAHRLQVEVETPDDNRLHLSESAPIDPTLLQPGDEPAPDHHEPLPESRGESHRERLPEATDQSYREKLLETNQPQHQEILASTAPTDNRQSLRDQPSSLLPPDLPSLELEKPNFVHVDAEPDGLPPEQESAHPESDVKTIENGIATTPVANAGIPPQAHSVVKKPKLKLSMNVHQREVLAQSIADSAVIDERLHRVEESVVKLTEKILRSNR